MSATIPLPRQSETTIQNH